MRVELTDMIKEVIRLACDSERAGINATLCGTDWDRKKAHRAEEQYEAAYGRLEMLLGKIPQ